MRACFRRGSDREHAVERSVAPDERRPRQAATVAADVLRRPALRAGALHPQQDRRLVAQWPAAGGADGAGRRARAGGAGA